MMRFKFIWLFLLPLQVLAQGLKVQALKCDYKENPLGIESAAPRLSWQLRSTERNTVQTAYHILVADDSLLLSKNEGNLWDSKKVNSSASIQVAYDGNPLKATKTYYWKVMVWDNHHQTSGWSRIQRWQMGLLTTADWKGAKWIAYDKMPDSNYIVPFIHGKGPKKLGPANDVLPLMRKTFEVSKPVKKATLFICGLGQFDLSLNGKKVGDHFLDPGWTKYDKQALYVPFDITCQLKQGANAIGVMLGNGFYYIPRDKRYRKLTGAYGYPKMMCRLVLQYEDGTESNIISNDSWKTAAGPVTFTSIYAGEDYNANLEQPGWNTPDFNDHHWRKVIVTDGSPQLIAQFADPVKVFEKFAPIKVSHIADNKWVFDLGQNSSAIPYIKVKGKKGDTIKILPAELVNADGSASQKGSGGPAYYTYILKGEGEEEWHPQFTYYGFRYLQVEGGVPSGNENSTKLPTLIEVKGLHIRNAAERVGAFSCSNELFNKTFKLIDWSIQSNMVSLFTDCPHREKLGWLEEAHLVGNSIQYNYDISGLTKKSISDMEAAQYPDGLIPEIAPEYVRFEDPFRDSPEWGSNAIILPWYTYQWYGDKTVLEQSYSMMRRYLDYLASKANNHILTQGLGDWYDIGPKGPGLSQNTAKGITATAIYYYDLTIAAKVALLIGKPQDATAYANLAQQVRQAFNSTFFNPQTKQYGSGSQTANAMAVYMKLVEPQYEQAVVNNIVKDIKDRNNAFTAGDIGFRYLLKVLDDEGRSDVIFDMNSNSSVPGYGYQLAKGATALTESWQALPTVSNDHLMLGHLMEWFYSGLGGIRPAKDAIAYKQIDIRPEVVGDVKSARAVYNAAYGEIVSDWKKDDRQFNITVQIPANTTATVYLPVSTKSTIKEGGRTVKNRTDVQLIKYEKGRALLKVGSGIYHFTVQ